MPFHIPVYILYFLLVYFNLYLHLYFYIFVLRSYFILQSKIYIDNCPIESNIIIVIIIIIIIINNLGNNYYHLQSVRFEFQRLFAMASHTSSVKPAIVDTPTSDISAIVKL